MEEISTCRERHGKKLMTKEKNIRRIKGSTPIILGQCSPALLTVLEGAPSFEKSVVTRKWWNF